MVVARFVAQAQAPLYRLPEPDSAATPSSARQSLTGPTPTFWQLPIVRTGATVVEGAVAGGCVAGGAVTGGWVAGGAVTVGWVAGGAVTGGWVAGGAVTFGTVAAGAGDVDFGAATVEAGATPFEPAWVEASPATVVSVACESVGADAESDAAVSVTVGASDPATVTVTASIVESEPEFEVDSTVSDDCASAGCDAGRTDAELPLAPDTATVTRHPVTSRPKPSAMAELRVTLRRVLE